MLRQLGEIVRAFHFELLLLQNCNTRKPWSYLKSTFPRLLAENPCTVTTPAQAEVSKQEQKQQGKGDKFQHRWLFEEILAFSRETGMWWLVYIEGEGMYCLLCRVHNTKNRFNKDSKLNCEPSIRYNRSALFNSKANRHPGGKKTWAIHSQLGTLEPIFLIWSEERAPLHSNTKQFKKKQTRWHSTLRWVLSGWHIKRLPMWSWSPC